MLCVCARYDIEGISGADVATATTSRSVNQADTFFFYTTVVHVQWTVAGVLGNVGVRWPSRAVWACANDDVAVTTPDPTSVVVPAVAMSWRETCTIPEHHAR